MFRRTDWRDLGPSAPRQVVDRTGGNASTAQRPQDLKIPIDLRAVLNSIDPNDFLGMINPVEDTPVTYPQFAQAGQIFWHTNQSPMDHDSGVVREP